MTPCEIWVQHEQTCEQCHDDPCNPCAYGYVLLFNSAQWAREQFEKARKERDEPA